jgi:hypothetical protein
LGISFNKASTVPAGSLAKAASVGAKTYTDTSEEYNLEKKFYEHGLTVKGPFPFRVGTNPAAVKAAARVLKLPADTAVSTISATASCELVRQHLFL